MAITGLIVVVVALALYLGYAVIHPEKF